MGRSDQKSATRGAGLTQALSGRTGSVVHLTHNDLDAVGSDAIHRRKYGDVFTIWCSVGRFITNIDTVASSPGRGDLLSISDLGYQQGVEQRLARARSNGWRIEWRDHHRWRDEEARAVKKKTGLLHIDVTTCATGIVARDLAPGDAVAEIAGSSATTTSGSTRTPGPKMLGQVVMRKAARSVRDNLVRAPSPMRRSNEYAGDPPRMERDITGASGTTIIERGRYRIALPLYGYRARPRTPSGTNSTPTSR